MNGTIFDLADEKKTGTIFDIAEKLPKKENLQENENQSFYENIKDILNRGVEKAKSIESAATKGLIQGTVELGRMIGPLNEPYNPEEIKNVLDEYFPSEEGSVETFAERGTKLLPSLLVSGGSVPNQLLKATGAAGASTIAKEMGASEPVQSIAELLTLLTPDLKKLIKEGKSNKEIIDFARKKGVTEESLSPILKKPTTQRGLGKLAFKRGKLSKNLNTAKEEIGEIYNQIDTYPSAQETLSRQSGSKLINDLKDKINRLPNSVSSKIEKDLIKLEKSQLSARDIMDFYRSIGKNIGSNAKELSILKEPVVDSLFKIDPTLANDFVKTNELYSKWAQASKILSPSLASDLIEGSIPIQFIYGLATANPIMMKGVLAEIGIKKISTELLTNPRLQNLSKKMIESIKQNKLAIAQNIWNQISNEIGKKDPKIGKKLKEVEILKELEKKTE